jgi:nucleotide-binding universal stress UspA family protein
VRLSELPGRRRGGLLIAADDRRADPIAIGTRGVGPLRATSTGSTARQIVHHSTIPVLVVRGAAVPSEEPQHAQVEK